MRRNETFVPFHTNRQLIKLSTIVNTFGEGWSKGLKLDRALGAAEFFFHEVAGVSPVELRYATLVDERFDSLWTRNRRVIAQVDWSLDLILGSNACPCQDAEVI